LGQGRILLLKKLFTVDASLFNNAFHLLRIVDHMDALAPIQSSRLQYPNVLSLEMTEWHH
jgi:hypothetical protein